MAPVPYPVGPAASPAPAVGVAGLVLHPRAAHPEHAVRFAAWLYEPSQQEWLGALGYPPVAGAGAPQARWAGRMHGAAGAAASSGGPVFDPARYDDFNARLPGRGLDGVSVDLAPGAATPRPSDFLTWAGACTQMYAGADVATTLARLVPGVGQLARALPSPGHFPAC